MDPYSFDFMAKDRIRELEREVADQQRLAIGKKRHLTTWLTAVVHLWAPNDPVSATAEDRDHDVSA